MCLMWAATLSVSAEPGERITEYEEHHVYRISPRYVDKPIDIRMPECWDGDVDAVRVKIVYKAPDTPHGMAAHYLKRADWPLEERRDDNGNRVVQVVVQNTSDVDIMYIDFVFRIHKGVSCV